MNDDHGKHHSFEERLAFSHSFENAGWWEEVYKRAFPGLRSAVSVRADGWAQRAGIDRVLTLRCGRVIKVDEKVRENDWPDILLERWSDEAHHIPGWIQKPLACEFIAYAFIPSATCYLLPVLTLQRAWRLCGRDWIKTCREVRARNNGYTTVSYAIPNKILFNAVADAMCVCWQDE